MLRVMATIVTSMLLGAWAGYNVPRLVFPGQVAFEFRQGILRYPPLSPFHPGGSYRCMVITGATLFYTLHQKDKEPIAKIETQHENNTFAIKVANDGKSVEMISDSAVRLGETKAARLPIVDQSEHLIVAGAGDDELVLNSESNTALFSWKGTFDKDLIGSLALLRCV
jgi:hypothetical protein